MNEFVVAREIEVDLRDIIFEANAKKTIPHVRGRAERAVASILMITDKESLDRSVEEVLSTLLMTTEVGSMPRLILLSLNILQKLAASGVITSDTFLHMVTVLCKAASSLTGVLVSVAGTSVQQEVEGAQLKCLQTLHLLQVPQLGPFFLDEVALSQIIGMCTNLASHPTSGPVLSQTAMAALSQLQLFVLEASSAVAAESQCVIPKFTPLNAAGELVGVSQLADAAGRLKPLFLLTHDLVTMSSPLLTNAVFCHLFGASRIKPALAHDMLGTFFDFGPFWIGNAAFSALISGYILPMISKTLSSDTDMKPCLRLFAKLARSDSIFSETKIDIQKNFTLITSSLLDESLTPPSRVLFTETATVAIASNPFVIRSDLEVDLAISGGPLGGDSPVKRANQWNLVEAVVESTCMFVHHLVQQDATNSLFLNIDQLGIKSLNDGTGNNAFSLLFSQSADAVITEQQVVGVSCDFVLVFVDTCSKHALVEAAAFTWPAVLSCLTLIASHNPHLPGVLATLEKLLVLLATARSRDGVAACVASAVKIPGITKFLLNMFQRLAALAVVKETFTIALWRMAIKQFEIAPSSLSIEDLAVQGIALDSFFSSCSDSESVATFVAALLPSEETITVTQWTTTRVGQVVSCDAGIDALETVWADQVGPFLHRVLDTDKRVPVTSAEAVIDMCCAVIVAALPRRPDAVIVVIASLCDWVRISPLRAVDAMLETVSGSGHMLTPAGWSGLIDTLQVALEDATSQELSLRLLELIVDEFDSGQTDRIVPLLGKVGLLPSSQLSVTSAFKVIGLVKKCSATCAPDLVKVFFESACSESRSEVRNCALKTIAGSGLSCASVLGISVSVAGALVGASTTPDSSDMIIHHSRDSEQKRWSETTVLALSALSASVRSSTADDAEVVLNSSEARELFHILFCCEVEESVTAAVKVFVDIFKTVNFIPLMVSAIEAECERVISCSTGVPLSSSLLLPLLLQISTSLPGEATNPLLELFRLIITHPAVHLGTAIPFPSATRERYVREVEAFPSIVTVGDEQDAKVYKSAVDGLRLPPLFEAVSAYLGFDERVIDILLMDVFRNSFTISLAARCVDYWTEHMRSFSPVGMEAFGRRLLALAESRKGPVGVASTGMWKLATQSLLLAGEDLKSDLLKTLRLIDGTDALDYTVVSAVIGDPRADEFLASTLAGELPQEFSMFLLLVAMCGSLRQRAPERTIAPLFIGKEQVTTGLSSMRMAEIAPFVAPRLTGFVPAVATGINRLCAEANDWEAVCAMLATIRASESSPARLELKVLIWPSLVGLVTVESVQVRSQLARVLLVLGP